MSVLARYLAWPKLQEDERIASILKTYQQLSPEAQWRVKAKL